MSDERRAGGVARSATESGYAFPMERVNHRAIATDYAGPIDVWDIDKTYLETEFESILDLVGRAFESAIDKKTRPGARALLRALRFGPMPTPTGTSTSTSTSERTPLYFVSASPPQMRSKIEKKFLLDGVEWDGISMKDHLALMRSGRFREVRRHVAYKLSALLEFRLEWPPGAREWLAGDDAESDALVYSLFAEIMAGTLAGDALLGALALAKVEAVDAPRLVSLAERARAHVAAHAPPEGTVAGIFIFRAAKRPRLDLAAFPRVTPVADAVALAEALHARGRLDDAGVADVRAEAGKK